MKQEQRELIALLEMWIFKEQSIHITPPAIAVMPRKILYIDDELTLVAEEISCHKILNFSIHKIEEAYPMKMSFKNVYTSFEIDNYLEKYLGIDNEIIRLVMKINQADNLDENQKIEPKFLFYTKPYMISNLKGDLIWAANVEKSERLFMWLKEMQERIEILDPLQLRLEFDRYLMNSKKIA